MSENREDFLKKMMAESGFAGSQPKTEEVEQQEIEQPQVQESQAEPQEVESVGSADQTEVAEQSAAEETQSTQTEQRAVEAAPSIGEQTGGKFQTVAELIKAYEEKSSQPQVDTSLIDYFNVNEFIKGAIDYYKETGSLAEYAAVKGVDYNGMDKLSLLKEKFFKDNAGRNPELVNLLWEKEVESKYSYTEDASDIDKKIRDLQLEDDAEKAKQYLIEIQSKFKAPERKPQQAEPLIDEEQRKADQLKAEMFLNGMKDSKEYQIGDQSFSLSVDKDFAKEQVSDINNFISLFVTESGEFDYDKYVTVAHFAKDPSKFMKDISVWARSSEKDSIIDEARNVQLEGKSDGASKTPGSEEEALLLAALKAAGRR